MAQVESAVANLDASTFEAEMAKALADALGMTVEVPGAALEVVQVRAGERGLPATGPVSSSGSRAKIMNRWHNLEL